MLRLIFLTKGVNSKIMGMDALFVEIAKRYYISGEAFWANEKKPWNRSGKNLLFCQKNKPNWHDCP